MEFEIWQYLIFFIAALFGGFIDAVAGGGGLICVPVLLWMGVPPHIALSTNKFQGSFGSFTAAANFAIKGMVNFKEIFVGIIFTLIGAAIGTKLVTVINKEILNYIIPVLLGAILIYTIFSPKMGETQNKPLINQNIFYIVFGFILGFYDGFFGPGTGSFWTFALVGILGLTIKKAVANTKILNFVSNIVSLCVFLIGTVILFKVGIIMAIGQILGGYLGSNMVIKKDVKFIRLIFLSVVGFIVLNLIYKALKQYFGF